MTREELSDLIPDDVKASVTQHGFAKLAASSRGLPDAEFETVARFMGVKIAQRRQEWRGIEAGLTALNDLARGGV